MDEEPAYLQPDFDPNSLKVPELRNLLLEYDVDYPSAAKKGVLVDLFNEHIAPRAQRITEQRSRVRASSRGIISVDRTGNALVGEPRRGSRRVRRKSVADTDSDAGGGSDILESITMSPVKKTPARRTASPSKRTVSGRYSRVGTDDTGEPEAPRTVRKTRRSSAKPAELVPETPAPQQTHEPDDDPEKSPFSMENVFQKSSPAPSAYKENRRKSMQPQTGGRVSSPPGRRLTDFLLPTTSQETESEESNVNYHGSLSSSHDSGALETYNRHTTGGPATRPSTKRYEAPASHLGSGAPMPVVNPDMAIVKIEKVDDDDLIPAGEEFTPEGAQEVAEAGEAEGAVVPRKSGRRRSASTPPPASALWTVFATLLIAYFIWWRKEKIEIGYCGVGNTAPKGLKPHHHDYRDWATLLRPECEPCPPNAICKPNYTAECKSDYVLVNSPLSLFGLIPVAPTCEPDSEKLRRIAILSDEAIKVIRKRAADVECGDIAPIKPHLGGKESEAGNEGEEGKEWKERAMEKFAEGGPLAQGKGMDETELYRAMYELKAPKLSDEQFNELFKASLEDVVSREEIEVKEDRHTHRLILASTSLASLPLICSIRLSLLSTLAFYRIELLTILAAIISIIKINTKIQRRRKNNELVTKYVHLVLDMLQRKAEMAAKSGREDDAAVPVVQMRDQVLRHEFNPERRQEVWMGVQGVVEHNSNVRAMSREVRGEVFRVWMWIGGVGGLEGVGVKREEGSGLGRGVKQEEEIEFPRIVA